MEEKIKTIVAQYTKVPAGEITGTTVIDRSAVASSILLHRMYANLANEGIIVNDYLSVNNFGELLSRINGSSNSNTPVAGTFFQPAFLNEPFDQNGGVGIDIEEISMMPLTNDYRADAFYQLNFAASEIAYCILQPHPLSSFAGLFAAKEAIVKASNYYKNIPFHSIVIEHLPEGKPYYKNFQLSISHSKEWAVAVAFTSGHQQPADVSSSSDNLSSPSQNVSLIFIIAFAALVIAVLAMLFTFIHS